MERLTIEFDGNYIPAEMCSVSRDGEVDDVDGCKDYCDMVNGVCEGGCAIQKCFNRLGEYEDLDEQGRLLIVPRIKRNKTLYWIWGDEIMPVLFKGITSCVVDDDGNPHVMCKMTLKKDRTFVYIYRRKPVEYTSKAGEKRYFYSENIGQTVFLEKEAAEKALKEMEDRKNGEVDKL